MKALYITDLHGDRKKYDKALEIAKAEGIKLIIDGGDMLPKRCDRHTKQPEFIQNFLRDYFEKLRENGITYLAMLGNDDLEIMDEPFEALCSEFDNVFNTANQKVKIDGYEFIGMNSILDTPFYSKERVVFEEGFKETNQDPEKACLATSDGYETVSDWFNFLKTRRPNMKDILNSLPTPERADRTVYIFHMPPAGIKLGRTFRDVEVGSNDITDFLKSTQPLLSLHGHIHESPDRPGGVWKNTIGKTVCLQPGQSERGDPELVYMVLDLDEKQYERKITPV